MTKELTVQFLLATLLVRSLLHFTLDGSQKLRFLKIDKKFE